MQQRTIKKVLTELKSDKPDLSYIRGLLEGLVDEDVPKNALIKPVINEFDRSDEETPSEITKIGRIAELR